MFIALLLLTNPLWVDDELICEYVRADLRLDGALVVECDDVIFEESFE